MHPLMSRKEQRLSNLAEMLMTLVVGCLAIVYIVGGLLVALALLF